MLKILIITFTLFLLVSPSLAHPRLLLLGIDGLDWDIVYHMGSKLPNIQKLYQNGSYGVLETLYVNSPPIWTTIATGYELKQHGVRGFDAQSSDRKKKALWNIADENDRRGLYIGWWATCPAEPINGVIVSNYISPDSQLKSCLEREVIYPPKSTSEFLGIMRASRSISKPDWLMQRVFQRYKWDVSYFDLAEHLISTKWDIFSVYVRGTDIVGHVFSENMYETKGKKWPFNRKKESVGKEGKYWKSVYGMYEFTDERIGRLLNKVDEDTIVALVSDHGFRFDGRTHRFNPLIGGVFIFYGKGIKKSHKVHGVNILDILPTVLTSVGLPVSQELPGKVIDIFDKPTQPILVDTFGKRQEVKNKNIPLDSRLKEELIAVGYIE